MIKSFRFENQKSIRYAECEDVPSLMIIVGPNGSGKSTLLNALRTTPSDGKKIYIGAHRNFRKQNVQARHLMQNQIVFEDILSGTNIPGFEGIRIHDSNRDAWNADESANYLKHRLCQIETIRSEAITSRYDKDGAINKTSMPDPWEPMKQMVNTLLPHLNFEKIDPTNRDGIKCLFSAHAKGIIVDIDELSSGEKAIIQLFFPLIEHRINQLLEEIRTGFKPVSNRNISILIDEPELHLHPNLQIKILDYLRLICAQGDSQVIITTHSPTILETASSDELYLMMPAEQTRIGESQLKKLADHDETLAKFRTYFGSTANLTALQTIILVEGKTEHEIKNGLADRKIYRALHSEFDKYTIIPCGGKSEVFKMQNLLNEMFSKFTDKLRVVALVDRDTSEQIISKTDVFLLPVSMIENFLIDPDVAWEVIQSVVEKTLFTAKEDLTSGLDNILDEIEKDEIERRVTQGIKAMTFRLSSPISSFKEQLDSFNSELNKIISEANIGTLEQSSRDQVSKIRSENKRREYFDGKKICKEFHNRHLKNTALSKTVYLYESARRAKQRKSVQSFFEDFFAKISNKL